MCPSASSSEKIYSDLLAAYWQESPGILRTMAVESSDMVQRYLTTTETLDNAAVALGFLAQDELLLAGNLLAKGDADAWRWFDKAQAHAYLAYKYLSEAAWVPSKYSRPVFGFGTFCAFYTLALVRGDETAARWYAQQIYNLKRGGLADSSCPAFEYVDFYFELAVAMMNDEWPDPADLTEEMGPYQGLFKDIGNPAFQKMALLACAEHHLDLAAITAAGNEEEAAHPFRSIGVGHVAYELWGWLALQKQLSPTAFGPDSVQHPMLLRAFFEKAPAQQAHDDDITSKFEENACALFGQAWQQADKPKNFDEM